MPKQHHRFLISCTCRYLVHTEFKRANNANVICTYYVHCTYHVQTVYKRPAVIMPCLPTMYIPCTLHVQASYGANDPCTYCVHIIYFVQVQLILGTTPTTGSGVLFFQFQVSILFNMTFPGFFANLRTFLHTKGLKNVAVYQS